MFEQIFAIDIEDVFGVVCERKHVLMASRKNLISLSGLAAAAAAASRARGGSQRGCFSFE